MLLLFGKNKTLKKSHTKYLGGILVRNAKCSVLHIEVSVVGGTSVLFCFFNF